MQKHGERYIWNPPAIPLSTEEMDSVFALPYKRVPHPGIRRCPYSGVRDDPLLDQHYARLFRRLFLLLITEHEGRIIQSRSEDSIINESKRFATRFPALPALSPIWRPDGQHVYAALSPRAEQTRRRPASIRISARTWIPTMSRRSISIRARELKGIKKILIAYAMTSPSKIRAISKSWRPTTSAAI
jgi:hypothetical protein